MIPLLTRQAVRDIDRHAIDVLGVSGIALMENAGAGATRFFLERHRERRDGVVIVGGVGQNGGDGWVLARHLLVSGIEAKCLLVGAREKVTGDALVNLKALEALGCAVQTVGDPAALAQQLQGAQVLVDGLFGTGLDRVITGLYEAVIHALNASLLPIFSLDLPSGIHADTGQVLGVAVRAQQTATFAARKRGLEQYPGVEQAGEVRCVSIGVPVPVAAPCGLITKQDVAQAVPSRAGDAHKGSAGHVLVVGGGAGRTGAALLCALGAQRAGAGLVTIASDTATRAALDHKVLEAMTAELGAEDELASALRYAKGKRSAVVGPGLGLSESRKRLARDLAAQLPCATVLDADALTAQAGVAEGLRNALAPRILTPHPAEAARLLECDVATVQADRYGAAAALSERTGQVAVLKGARTVIAAPDGRLRVCGFGTQALASGGTGDVLAGVIAALAGSLPAFEAAWAGAALHALSGERAATGDRGLLASEVAAALPAALLDCRVRA